MSGLNPERDRARRCAAYSAAIGFAATAAAVLAAYPAALLAEYGLSAAVLARIASFPPDLVARPAAWLGGDGVYARWIAEGLAATGLPPVALLATPLAGAIAAAAFWRLSGPHSFAPSAHGAARFARTADLRRGGLLARSGFVLGRWGRGARARLIRGTETLSVAIISPPGTGKTVHLLGHILADHPDSARIPGPSMIVNDPKGEIYGASAGWRSTLGPVFHIRWTELEGVSWNPLSPRNLAAGREAAALRAELVAELGRGYEKPAITLNQCLALLRDYNATWRRTLLDVPGTVGTVLAGFAFDEALFERIVRLQSLYAAREQYVDRLTTVAVPENVGPHWMVSGRAALAGFLLYEMARGDRLGYEPSIGRMLDWLSAGADPGAGDEAEAFEGDLTGQLLDDAIAEARENGDPARVVSELGALRIKPDRERGSVISTAIGKLNIFRNVAIRARTSRSDIAFEDLRGIDGRPVTVYFDIPLEDAEALGIPTGMFLQGAAAYLISQDEKAARTRPVQFLLDEFWTLPKLDAVTQIPALGRGQWVQLAVIGQSFAQISDKLGKEALDILKSALAWKLFFAQNALETAKEASEMIGQRTVEMQSRSQTQGLAAAAMDGFRVNVQKSFQGVPLVRAEELMSLEKLEPAKRRWGELVLLVQGMMNTPIGGPGRPCRPAVWFRDRKLKRRGHLRRRDFIEGPAGVALKPWPGQPGSGPGEETPARTTIEDYRRMRQAAG